MLHEFGVGKSTLVLKIDIVKLIDNYSKMKNSHQKNYFKSIKDKCKANSIEFKLVKNVCLKFTRFLFMYFWFPFNIFILNMWFQG